MNECVCVCECVRMYYLKILVCSKKWRECVKYDRCEVCV